MEITGKNLIGNKLSGDGEKIFYGENAATGKKSEPGFREASFSEINRAIEKSKEAFQVYRNKSGLEKAAFLETIADEIMSLGDDLIRRAMEETGLPEARLNGERARTVGQLKLFAQLLQEGSWVGARIDSAQPDRKPAPRPDIRSMQKALGPAGIFGASNFPFAFSVAGGDTVSALAAGCTVVFKAHPAHPGTCELTGAAIIKAVKKSGMPEGTFSMLQGRSVEVGMAIVRNPLIQSIGFTGSFAGGKALFDEANRRPNPIPVYAEMGSTNPVFILPNILKDRTEKIAEELSASVTMGVGQFCTNPGLVFTEQSVSEDDFKNHLSKFISAYIPGVMLSNGIRNNFQKGIEKLKAIQGVKQLTGKNTGSEETTGAGHLFHSTASLFLLNHELEEEVFGPSTLIITADNKQQLMEAANKLGGHLTATIHGTESDLLEYTELIAILEQKVGRLLLNGYPTGVEVCQAMVHGGPFPSTTDSKTSSVGTLAIHRFTRPVCYQNFSQQLLPPELKDSNPLHIWRLFDSEMTNQ
jgi:2,5-dioxopentanoate dehydrogenase